MRPLVDQVVSEAVNAAGANDAEALSCPNCGRPARIAKQKCTRCGYALPGVMAGFSRRAGSFLLDVTIAGGFAVGLLVIAAYLFDATVAVLVAVGIGVVPIYFIGLNAIGGTWGKRLLGLRLETHQPFQHIGGVKAAIRFVVSLGSALAFGSGYFWFLVDGQHQTWHDKAAGSFVRDERPGSGWHWLPITVLVWIVIPVLLMWSRYL